MSDEKVWRGWARWLTYADRWGVTDYDVPKLFTDTPYESRQVYEPHEVVLLPAADYDALLARIAEARANEWPKCHICGKPAVCFGEYSDSFHGFSCDECCDHGNEDGWCDYLIESTPIKREIGHEIILTERDTLRAEVERLRAELAYQIGDDAKVEIE